MAGYAKALGRTPEFQKIQVKHANGNFQQGFAMCQQYSLWSERAVALMFDIVTQNGSISKTTQAQNPGRYPGAAVGPFR